MRRAQTSAKKPLSNLEQTIMQTVWRHPGCTADEVRLALEAEHPLKESTVRTLLRRLEAKGYLAHAVEGRTFLYRAVSAPQQVAASAVRRIIDRFCNGSLEQLLVGLVESEMVDGKELRRLAARVEEHREAHASSPADAAGAPARDGRESRKDQGETSGREDGQRHDHQHGGRAQGKAPSEAQGKEKGR